MDTLFCGMNEDCCLPLIGPSDNQAAITIPRAEIQVSIFAHDQDVPEFGAQDNLLFTVPLFQIAVVRSQSLHTIFAVFGVGLLFTEADLDAAKRLQLVSWALFQFGLN